MGRFFNLVHPHCLVFLSVEIPYYDEKRPAQSDLRRIAKPDVFKIQ